MPLRFKRPRRLAGACSFLLLVLCTFFAGGMPGSTLAAGNDGSKGVVPPECCGDEPFELYVKALEEGKTAAELVGPVSSDFETLGKACFYLNRWEEALGAFRKAAELNPHDPVLHFLLASTLSELGRHEEAVVEYRILAKMKPDDGYALFSLASGYKQLGQNEKAIEEFERMAPLLPRNIFTDLVTKAAFAGIEDRRKAGDGTKRITRPRSPSPAPNPGMFQAYCFAVKAYEYKIGALKDPEAHYRLGVMYGFVQQYRRAADAFRRAAALRSDYLDACLLLGYTYGKDGLRQYGESIEAYRRGLELKPDSVECLYGIGTGYRALGKHKEAVEMLDRAIKVAVPGGPVFLTIGYEFEALREYERALGAYEKAVAADPDDYLSWSAVGRLRSVLKQDQKAVEAFRKATALEPDYDRAYVGLGWAHFGLGQFREAAVAFETASRIRPDNPGAYRDLGLTYRMLNLFDRSIEASEKAVSLKPDNAHMYDDLAATYSLMGLYEKSIEVWKRALKKNPDCRECLVQMATAYASLGDHDGARRVAEKALDLCRKKQDPICEADLLLEMGGRDLMNRRDVAADNELGRALSIFREHKMKPSEALALEKTAFLQFAIGNNAAALKYLQDALSVYRDLGDSEAIVRVCTDMATATPGSSERIRYAKLAIDLAGDRRSPSYGNVFRSYGVIFETADTTSIDDRARKEYARRFQAMMEGSRDPLSPGVSLIHGASFVITGRDDLARGRIENVLRAASKTGQPDLKVAALEQLILLETRRGDIEAAKRYCFMALDEIDYMRRTFQSLSGRLSISQSSQAWYAVAVASAGHSRNEEAAFGYAERARGSEFLDVFGGGAAAGPKDMDIVKRERLLKLRTYSIEQEIRELNADKKENGKGKSAHLEAELRKARDEYAQFLETIERERPELSSFFVTSAITLKETQALLDPDTTLLEYFVAGPQVFLWVVERSSFKMIVLPVQGADLGARIEAYREKLKKNRPDYEREARELFDLLIRPAKPYIRTGTIGIVPHGKLHYLPFQALLDVEERDGKTEKRFLIEEYNIFYTPSAGALRYTHAKRRPIKGRILAFGNPDLGDKDMDLPYAEKELAEIRRAFPGAELYLGKDATKRRASRLSSDFSVIHFASHAEMDAKNPFSSSIRLAGSGDDDGRLTVGEVFGLDLRNTSLVTLSACETGTGELRGGDEMVGLTRAFIYAGAPSIVASLWAVNDEATSKLMALFYSNLKRFSKAEALRRAQTEMIRGEADRGIVRGVGGTTTAPATSQKATRAVNGAHPFFWAPFVLLGDWR